MFDCSPYACMCTCVCEHIRCPRVTCVILICMQTPIKHHNFTTHNYCIHYTYCNTSHILYTLHVLYTLHILSRHIQKDAGPKENDPICAHYCTTPNYIRRLCICLQDGCRYMYGCAVLKALSLCVYM